MSEENEVRDINIKEVQGELFIENDFPDAVILGVKVVSTMNIINATDTDVKDSMLIVYPLVENLELISANSSRGVITKETNQVMFNINELLKGESVFITLKFMPKKEGNIENMVTIYGQVPKEIIVSSKVVDLGSKIDGVGDKIDSVGNAVIQVESSVNTVTNEVTQVGNSIGNAIENVVTRVASSIGNAIENVVMRVDNSVNAVGSLVEQVRNSVNSVQSAVGQVGGSVNTVGNSVTQVGESVNAVGNLVDQVRNSVNAVQSAVGQVGGGVNTVVDAVAQVGGSVNTVGNAVAQVQNNVIDAVGNAAMQVRVNVNEVGSAVTKVGGDINLLIKKADGIEASAIKDIKNMVEDIENKVGTIIIPEVYKLTTGIVVKDFNANSLVVEIKNTTKSEVTIKIGLVDQTSVLEETRYRTLNIEGKSCKNFIFGDVPLEYEVIFEGINEGVYIWTATRTSDAFTSVNLSNFIGSNTFSHKDLFIKKDIKDQIMI